MQLTWPEAPKIHVNFSYRVNGRDRAITQSVVTEYAHRVYQSTFKALCKRRPARRMYLQGWRCKTQHGSKQSILEIGASQDHQDSTILASTPLESQKFQQFILAAQCKCRKGDTREYEPRLLRITGLHIGSVEVLWLKPTTRSLGVFVPLDSWIVGLMPGQPYGIRALRRALLDLQGQ